MSDAGELARQPTHGRRAADQRHRPLHDVVGVRGRAGPAARTTAAGRRRGRAARSTRWPARTSWSAAGTTSPGCAPTPTHGLVARAETSRRVQAAYHALRRTALGRHLRPVWSVGGAAPAGGVQQGPRAGVPGRRGAARRTSACTRSSAPTTGTCCPTTSAGAMLRRARHGRARRTPTCGPTPSRRSRSATTSGSSRSRPTSCTASSTSCATCGRTDARRHVREELPFYTGTAGCRGRATLVSDPAADGAWQVSSRRARPEADRVDAVALVGRGVVALALEDVAEVRAAGRRSGPPCGLHAQATGPRRTRPRSCASGAKNEGQPQWLSNFSSLRKSSAPQARHG